MAYFAFVIYNVETVWTPVTSLKALIDSDSRVIYQDPRTSTPGQASMTWMKPSIADVEAAWRRWPSIR